MKKHTETSGTSYITQGASMGLKQLEPVEEAGAKSEKVSNKLHREFSTGVKKLRCHKFKKRK